MWLITTAIALAIVTAAFLANQESGRKNNLDKLALMLLGAVIMIAVDKAIGYANEGGQIIEPTTSGLVPNALVLGMAMLAPLVAAWAVMRARSNPASG